MPLPRLAVLSLALAVAVRAEPGHVFPPLTAVQRAAIDAALPARASATPAQPRRLLVFYRTEGFVHTSIPFANEALKRLGETTGAYTTVIGDDMALFDPATLNTFDAVIFVSTTGLKFANPVHRKALLDFVAAGKGVIGLHAATDSFRDWPEAQALLGGLFHSHPWGSGDTVAVKLDEPRHVLNAAFDHRGFWIKDEIYQFTGPYSRDRQRVLLSLDMSRPENAKPADKLKRTDNDFPISWLKPHGPGRVFYSSLGHNADVFQTPELLRHFLDGIQFALGDLPADALPSASLVPPPEPALAPDDQTTLQQKAARARTAGATTPFWTIEAETGALAEGARLRAFTRSDPFPDSPTPELEASGRALVSLETTHASVTLTNRGPAATTLVLRAAIPDAPRGGGTTATLALLVDGVFRQRVTLSSAQTWLYGPDNGMSNNPADGRPHVFFDETRVRLTGQPIAPGATLTLRKDDESSAAFYWLDCIDLENPPPPRPRPENAVSVTEHGALADDELDDTAAFRAAIVAARSSGKSLWIPAGRFILTDQLKPVGLTIEGAGMWHTTLSRIRPVPAPAGHRNQLAPAGGVLRDFYINEDSVTRDPRGGGGTDYGINIMGDGWLVERIWFHHTRVGVWAGGGNGIVRDCRTSNTWADGINLNNSHSPHPLKTGMNLRAENNFVRGAGDDGLATFSDAGERADNTQMDGATLIHNTSIATWWANGLRVAGGKNVRVENNLVADTVVHSGIAVGIFGKTGQPLESCLVRGNVILRAGGTQPNTAALRIWAGPKAATRAQILENRIIAPLTDGMRISPLQTEVTVSDNQFTRPARSPILIEPNSTGHGIFERNTMTDSPLPAPSLISNTSATFTTSGPDVRQ